MPTNTNDGLSAAKQQKSNKHSYLQVISDLEEKKPCGSLPDIGNWLPWTLSTFCHQMSDGHLWTNKAILKKDTVEPIKNHNFLFIPHF